MLGYDGNSTWGEISELHQVEKLGCMLCRFNSFLPFLAIKYNIFAFSLIYLYVGGCFLYAKVLIENSVNVNIEEL